MKKELITLYYTGDKVCGRTSLCKIDDAIFWEETLKKYGFYVEVGVEEVGEYYYFYYYNETKDGRVDLLKKVLEEELQERLECFGA